MKKQTILIKGINDKIDLNISSSENNGFIEAHFSINNSIPLLDQVSTITNYIYDVFKINPENVYSTTFEIQANETAVLGIEYAIFDTQKYKIEKQCRNILLDEFNYGNRSILDIDVNILLNQISISIHDDKANVYFNYASKQEDKIQEYLSKKTGFKVAVTI